MALSAGAVWATLGGKFDRAGFDQFGSSMYRAQSQMEASEKRMVGSQQRVNESMRKMGQTAKIAATGGVVALGAAIAGSVKVAADFDKSMRNVNSIAKLNEGQFKNLSKSVLELSGKTAQAPKTLADGMYQLVSSGFNARDSLKILKSSAIAASAGLTTTETATTAVAAALNAYHLPASKAQMVSDQLFQTVNRGVITFDELSHTIGMVLPFANSLHVGLGQVGASISTMTKEGIPAAEATTYLKNAMVAFLKPSKDLQGAIKATGAESGEALVKQKGFQGALEAVAKTTDGTKSALQKLFPDIRASATAFALTGTNAKTAEGDVKAFGNTAGVTQKVFAEQSKSAAFQWNKFKAELQAAGVIIGSAVLPVLTKGISAVASWVEHLKNTGQLAAFGHSVAAGFKEAGQVFSDVASAGAKVAGVFLSIGRALDLGNATHLEALLAAIAGFKVAGVVAPLVANLAGGLSTLVLNARSAPTALAFLADLPISPLTAVAVGVGALAAGLILLGGHESTEAQLARDNAQAHRDQAAAIKSVNTAEQAAADAGLAAKQADLDLADAKTALSEAAKKYGKHSSEYKHALLDEQRAALGALGAHQDYAKQIGGQNVENTKRITKATEALGTARKRVADLDKMAADRAKAGGNATTDPAFIKARADATANVTRRTQEYVQALARANTSDASRQRLMSSSTQITEKNAQGVSLLIQAMQAVPKNVQSKILVDNQGALSKAGQLAFQLAKLGQQHTVTTILSNTTSARAAVAAFKAVLAGVPSKKVASIVATTHGKAEIDALNAAIARVQSKSATVTLTTIRNELRTTGSAPTGHGGRRMGANASGRSAGAAQTSLVGEGAAPEWVINPHAGTARYITDPTVMDLAPADYVIPTESKYRGRALGLLADVAASLGAAFAGGKKGKPHRYVPKPGHYLRLSPDQFDAKDQAAQQHLDQLRQDATEKDSKGHHTRKALAAQKHLHAARVARDKAHADLRASKRFASHIAALEQDAEIAGIDMGTADSENNQKAYDKAKSRRRGRLDRALSALLYEHARAKPGSQWERDIRQALAQIRGDIHDTATATAQAPNEFTKKEQTRLDQINADIALASLTDDTADDIKAATSLVNFLNPILASAQAHPGARGGITAVADLAGQVKSARDNLASLTDPGSVAAAAGGSAGATPDQQALLDQANLRATNAEVAIASQAAVIRAFGSPGDIGTGTGAGTAAQIVFQSYVPPSPQEALRLANYVVGGIDYQGASSSPRDTLGV